VFGDKVFKKFFNFKFRCPAYVQKEKYDKLKPKTEVYLFVGFLRRFKGGLLCSP